jgi:tetratricopeptide (TPR) repeat protein
VGTAIEELYPDRLTEHYEELAHHYEQGEAWEKALEYLVKAGQKAQQAYANREALAHYNRALTICERLSAAVAPEVLMTVYAGKGAVLSIMSEFLPSVEAYQRMVEVARQIGDRTSEAEALSQIGFGFFFAHEFEKALDYAEQAKELALAIGAINILPGSMHVIGLIHSTAGRLGEAALLWDEAVKLSKETKNKNMEGISFTMLGQFHNWKGEYEQALRLHEQTYTIGYENNLQDILMQTIFPRSIAYCAKGEYEQAIASLQEALGKSEHLGDKYFKCRGLNTLGWVYGELYNLELAIRYNREGVEASYIIGDPEIIRNAETNLGDYYLLLDDLDQAQYYLEKVYRDSQQRGKWGEESMKWRYMQHCCHSLGELWLTKGDAEKTLRFAEECLQLAEPTESRKNIVKGWRLQGQAYCHQGKLPEAEAVLHKALALAKEVGNPPQLWKTYQALGELYEKQGVTAQAHSAYARALAVIDDVASRLQDQELKQTFLDAKPVQEIRSKVASTQ